MNKAELRKVRESLLLQKSELLNKSVEFKRGQASLTLVTDEADAASLDMTNNISIHLNERVRMALYQIEKALSKIDGGVFGLCESCGVDIHPGRLKARPFTSLCIDCMEEQEGRRPSLQ